MQRFKHRFLIITIANSTKRCSNHLVFLNRKYAQQVEEGNNYYRPQRPDYRPHDSPYLLLHHITVIIND